MEAHGRERFIGKEERSIDLQLRGEARAFAPVAFLTWYSLPHFHFHLTTAYDILRHNGVPLGKRDYLGTLPAEVGP